MSGPNRNPQLSDRDKYPRRGAGCAGGGKAAKGAVFLGAALRSAPHLWPEPLDKPPCRRDLSSGRTLKFLAHPPPRSDTMSVAIGRAAAMQFRRLGKSPIYVSAICMGTMTFGSQADEAMSHRILDQSLEAGINFFDTAENYPVPPKPEWAGRTEEIFGRWLKTKPRDSIVVATKVSGPSHGWLKSSQRSGGRGQPEAPGNRLYRPLSDPLARPRRALRRRARGAG